MKYAIAERVNTDVNSSVTYKTDLEQYGVPEWWTEAGSFGDCEDYALLKYQTLTDQGWPPDQLGMVICRDETGALHCVLWANTDNGGFILDNRRQWPERPADLPYQWQSMLVQGQWRSIEGWQ